MGERNIYGRECKSETTLDRLIERGMEYLQGAARLQGAVEAKVVARPSFVGGANFARATYKLNTELDALR